MTWDWLRTPCARVRLVRRGAGEPLLFLHGEDGCHWSTALERLSARFEVLLPEHPGYGRSERPDWCREPADLALFYLDVAEALGVGRVHLVGHSLGGWLAAEIAVQRPTTLRSLVLSNPLGLRAAEEETPDRFMMDPEDVRRLVVHRPQSYAALVPLDEDPAEALRASLRDQIATVRYLWERTFDRRLERVLYRARVPALIVRGAHAAFTAPSSAERYRDAIPGSRLEELPGAGQLCYLDEPERFADAVAAFAARAGG